MPRPRRTEILNPDQPYPTDRNGLSLLQAISNAVLLADAEVQASARLYGPGSGWTQEMVRTREVLKRHRQIIENVQR